MNKENYKYALENIYPEFYKDHAELSETQSRSEARKNRKNCEEKKIESKLKMIVFNLEREIKEQAIMNRRNKETDSMISGCKTIMRSYSMKSMKENGKKQKCKTEEDYNRNIEENEEKAEKGKTSRKKSNKGDIFKKGKVEFPKLKTKNKFEENALIKKSLSLKKYKLLQLDDKEKLLGKAVLEKLEKHLKEEKQVKKLYYDRVKSVETVDDSFICHLKSKIKKADAVLTK